MEPAHPGIARASRRVLVKSIQIASTDLTDNEKQTILQILGQKLNTLLSLGPSTLETAVLNLLTDLGVYNKEYDELVELYIEAIKQDKQQEFYQSLILPKHHENLHYPTRLLILHGEAPVSIRSRIRDEIPMTR